VFRQRWVAPQAFYGLYHVSMSDGVLFGGTITERQVCCTPLASAVRDSIHQLMKCSNIAERKTELLFNLDEKISIVALLENEQTYARNAHKAIKCFVTQALCDHPIGYLPV
jgi:hypothetical protein